MIRGKLHVKEAESRPGPQAVAWLVTHNSLAGVHLCIVASSRVS